MHWKVPVKIVANAPGVILGWNNQIYFSPKSNAYTQIRTRAKVSFYIFINNQTSMYKKNNENGFLLLFNIFN
jgi:hypothetical protein